MELQAVAEGLAAVPGRRRIHVHSDSAYIVNCFRERWWERWEKNGWRNSGKQPVANRDLWERLLAETRRHDVVWHKVAGHAGDPHERARRRPRARRDRRLSGRLYCESAREGWMIAGRSDAAGGKSGLRRAGCWVTPRGETPRTSATEKQTAVSSGPRGWRGGKGETVR